MHLGTSVYLAGVAVAVGAVSCAGASASPFPYLAHGLRKPNQHASFAAFASGSVRTAALARPRSGEDRRPPPASLTSADGTGLELVSLRANAVLEGPLAFTELRLTFRNPSKRRIEGRFEIVLSPTASVSRLAMRMGDGRWQEAEVVERQRARQVYETYLHRRVDPLLFESKAGNSFRARIFPIDALADKEILIGYSEALASPDDPYRLRLAGLPEIGVVEASVLRDHDVVRLRKRRFTPQRDFVVPSGAGSAGLSHGRMLLARVTPRAGGRKDAPEDLLVLVDTSASRATELEAELAALWALSRELASAHGAELPLRVACFDQQVAEVYSGPVGKLSRRHLDGIRMRRAMGASNLEAALAWAAAQKGHRRLLLLSDGVATAGATELSALRRSLNSGSTLERADALAFGAARDESALRGLVSGSLARGGVLLDSEAPASEWAKRLGLATLTDVEVSIPSAEWVWPDQLNGLQAGDSVLVYARLREGARQNGRATVWLRGSASEAHSVPIAETDGPLLERAWVRAQIERLLRDRSLLDPSDRSQRAEIERRVVGLSMTHRVVTPFTALLVLETPADYRRFCIDRLALADILTVDATGVRVLRRSAPGQNRRVLAGCGGTSTTKVGQTEEWDSRTGGAVQGVVVDSGSGEPLAGVTVVATSPSLQGTQSAITDESGQFRIVDLPPGRYQVTFYYASVTVRRTNVVVSLRRATPVHARLDTSAAAGEVIEISDRRPMIDPTSTTVGVTVTRELTRQIPSGRTFSSTLGAAAGANADSTGVSFSGSSSLENTYYVDGVATTDLARGRGQASGTALGGRVAAVGKSSKRALHGRLLRIMRLLDKGRLEAGLVDALRWRTEAPADVMSVIALGEALEANGHLGLAARAYGSIIDLFPSRADMRRVAGGRLSRLDSAAAALAVDTYRKAVRERPDHPTGHRLLAFALLRVGEPSSGFEVLEKALQMTDPRGRFARDLGILREALGLIAAAWLAREPALRAEIRRRLEKVEVLVPIEPSLRFVLSWETDANDADLYVQDGASGRASFARKSTRDGRLSGNVRDGYGPEAFVITGRPRSSRYHLWVHYASRAMMGYGFGQVQTIAHDGNGGVEIDTRPFVVMSDGAHVDLGFVTWEDLGRATSPRLQRLEDLQGE